MGFNRTGFLWRYLARMGCARKILEEQSELKKLWECGDKDGMRTANFHHESPDFSGEPLQ